MTPSIFIHCLCIAAGLVSTHAVIYFHGKERGAREAQAEMEADASAVANRRVRERAFIVKQSAN